MYFRAEVWFRLAWNSKCHAHKKVKKRARNGQETPRSVWEAEDLADLSDLDLDQCVLKGQNQIFSEILSATGTKSLKKDQEMAELALFSTLSQASPWLG